ncbi:hypothetical protein Tco_0828309 [Tanacetum coccineum]
MRSDKLYKFSDRTLTGLRTSLDDITKNIQMKYLPKRRWSMLEKKRANIMIKAIDKQLKERSKCAVVAIICRSGTLFVAAMAGQVFSACNYGIRIRIYTNVFSIMMGKSDPYLGGASRVRVALYDLYQFLSGLSASGASGLMLYAHIGCSRIRVCIGALNANCDTSHGVGIPFSELLNYLILIAPKWSRKWYDKYSQKRRWKYLGNKMDCGDKMSVVHDKEFNKRTIYTLQDPEREFRSSRRRFKTLSLDELRSPDFNLFSDQENSEEEEAETMAETMEQYMSKTRADYGSGVARPKIEDKDNFELKVQFLKELRTPSAVRITKMRMNTLRKFLRSWIYSTFLILL